jgi:hypothetical protein
MTARTVLIAKQCEALQEIRDICEEIDSEAAAELTRRIPDNAIPNPAKQPEEYGLFMAQVVLILARSIRPKKRARPRNVQWHHEESKAS